MKKLVALLFACLMICASIVSMAEELDISQMTYDELSVLREKVDARMEELMRQYAIENGNRVITLDYLELELFEKTRKQLTATVKKVVEDAPEKTEFVWSSSDESIATVSSDGRVSAVSSGEAVITCAAADDEFIFATVPLKVGPRVTSVGLSTETLTMHLSDANPDGAVYQLEAILTPENALCQEVRWTSNDEEVATVDENGVIVAKKPGKVVIRATSNEEVSGDQKQKTRSCDVTIIRDVASIALDPEMVNVKKGSSVTLAASVLPEDASNQKLSWESSDETIATVSAGKVTAKSCGTCRIVSRATDGSEVHAVCDVTVYQPVTSIKLSETSINAYMQGRPVQITATVMPVDATDKGVTWKTSDTSVAVVGSNGSVVANGPGTCEIICTAEDGSGVNQKLSVKVPAFSIEQEEYRVITKKGISIPIKYFGKSSEISWTVSNSRILSADIVDKNGGMYIDVIPENAGTATITVKGESNESVKISVTVSDLAVYSTKSYPKASYEQILRYPEENDGKQIHIYGKVLQKLASGSTVVLRVGTTGGYYDSVFYITYSTDEVAARVIEDDYVTIYGKCTGTKTYETVRGNDVTIPSMKAEKIVIGKKSN